MPIPGKGVATIAALALLGTVSCLAASAQSAAGTAGTHPAIRTAAATGNIAVTGAWARATPPGVKVGAAYLSILNRGKQTDYLQSVSSAAASTAEMHRTTHENGVSRMRPAGALPIAAGQALKAEPGGLHVMLTGLKQPLVAGSRVPLVLGFRDAGAVTVQVEIRGAAAMPHEGHPGQ